MWNKQNNNEISINKKIQICYNLFDSFVKFEVSPESIHPKNEFFNSKDNLDKYFSINKFRVHYFYSKDKNIQGFIDNFEHEILVLEDGKYACSGKSQLLSKTWNIINDYGFCRKGVSIYFFGKFSLIMKV